MGIKNKIRLIHTRATCPTHSRHRWLQPITGLYTKTNPLYTGCVPLYTAEKTLYTVLYTAVYRVYTEQKSLYTGLYTDEKPPKIYIYRCIPKTVFPLTQSK